MKLADFPEVQDLPVRDKLSLVDDLWMSVASELDSLDVSDAERELLDQRWNAFTDVPNSALTLEQFQEKMKALRGE